MKLAGDIVFAGCIDEELRSYGTVDAIEKGYKADGVIVGEPTELRVDIAQRGLEWYEFNFTGKTVHGGGQREGVNAILMRTLKSRTKKGISIFPGFSFCERTELK